MHIIAVAGLSQLWSTHLPSPFMPIQFLDPYPPLSLCPVVELAGHPGAHGLLGPAVDVLIYGDVASFVVDFCVVVVAAF